MRSLALPGMLLWAAVTSATAAAAEPATPVSEQQDDPASAAVTVTSHVVKPRRLHPAPERVDTLRLPPGFEIELYADSLINPRMIAVADDGTVYVTRRTVGDVVMLQDENGDGRAEMRRSVASRPQMHGIAIDGDTVYLTTVSDVYRAERHADGTLGPLERIIDDLPEGGQHPNRTMAVGPDGKLYISVGSTCNACAETSQENAALVQAEPDGSYRRIFASGLRNTVGFAFEPGSGTLYGMDHGIDWLGDNEQHEELNRIEQGRSYGWPYVYDDGKPNPQDEPPGDLTAAAWAAQSVEPLGLYVPHAAPMQMAFYTGRQFPEEYRGDAFVAMRGSWNRQPPSGYEVVRIRFEEGRPVAFEPFVTGFLIRDGDGWGYFGRPVGIAQSADGALLIGDDSNGRLYRVSYTGEDSVASGERLEPTNAGGATVVVRDRQDPDAAPAAAGAGLALALLDPGETLNVRSAAFSNGDSIPDTYAAEQQNVSPPLAWRGAPSGTGSFAIIVEDPVEGREQPFVHWLAYNIPADAGRLREGIPGTAQVPLPRGLTQGRNDNGSIGWFGMKPPVGDGPHDYHFQVFALDGPLDVSHGADRSTLLDAMRGRVLAAGEIVGRFER